MMSSPQLESFSIIPEATDDLWTLITQENDMVLLEPSIFYHSQEDKNNNIGKESLESGNIVHDHQNIDQISSSPMMLDTANGNNYNLDSILFLDHQTDHNDIVQKGVAENGLLSPDVYCSDYAYSSLVQVSSSTMLLSVEDINARSADELLNSSAPPEGSDEAVLDLLLQESNDPQLLITDGNEQENSAVVQPSNGKGLTGKRVNAKSTRGRNFRLSGNNKMKVQGDHKEEGLSGKKQQHNAKEKIRRMKLHASCLALGALLPDSTRSKKRKSTRAIIDKAVEYIPELEEEIEKLTLRKNDMLSSTTKNKQPDALNHQNPHLVQLHQEPSVSVHRIRQGEFIIQIFTQGHSDGSTAFSNLLQKAEEEEGIMCIISASTLQVSDDGIRCHLHIKVNASLDGNNNLASLREKVISWLS